MDRLYEGIIILISLLVFGAGFSVAMAAIVHLFKEWKRRGRYDN